MEENLTQENTYIPKTTDCSFVSCCPSLTPKRAALVQPPCRNLPVQKYQDRAGKAGEANSIHSRDTPSTVKVNTQDGQWGLDSGGKTPPAQYSEQKLSSNWRHRAADLTHTHNRDVGKNKITTALVRRPETEHIKTILARSPANSHAAKLPQPGTGKD